MLAALSLMALEAALAAGVLLALFAARRHLGLAALYTTVGVLYYLATLLAATTFVQVAPGILLSPGSVALFPATLFTVLLVYIREDAEEARSMIYGLLAANIVASALGLLASQHLSGPLAVNPLGLPAELFVQAPRLFLVGLLALFADTILIILVYEALSRPVAPLFPRIALALVLVLVFDTLIFVTGGFVEQADYVEMLVSAMLGKSAAALVYAAALTLYLRRARPGEDARAALGDLFQVLTYRQKYEALRVQAARDPLTGAYNRGHCDEMLRAHVAAARRQRGAVALMMVAVDHFKAINDRHGHAEGDRALRVIAQALAGVARASDLVCRYGGEEFCLILPGTRPEAAMPLAARVLAEVPAACAQAGVAGGARITVTVGLDGCPDDGSAPEDLLRAADRRLYRGKRAGRDRLVAA